jgi:hypothetical protein
MVRLAGIEPTTPWFVAKYSIQLSYSRRTSNYITIFRLSTNPHQKIYKQDKDGDNLGLR